MISVIIILFALFVASDLMEYWQYHKKELQIEKSAKERGVALSDDERGDIEKYRSIKEKSLKMIVVWCVLVFILLLQETSNT